MEHDEWVFFLAGVLGPVRLVAEPLVLYRRHSSNATAGWLEVSRERSLRPAVGDYRRFAAHTAACAEYLERSRPAEAGAAERFERAARAYRRASENWSLRESLYAVADRRARARLLRRLVTGGAYGPRTSGGLGRAALAKDVAAGLALRVPAGSAPEAG